MQGPTREKRSQPHAHHHRRNRITFPGDVGTPTASLELAKLVFNSVLSRPGAKFTTFDICNFYLQTPLDRPEYARIKLSNIPEEFTFEYNLLFYARDGWVYFEIRITQVG